MYTAIKGMYENGVLTMIETPPEINKSEVVILFIHDSEKIVAPPKKRIPGGLLRLAHLEGKTMSIVYT